MIPFNFERLDSRAIPPSKSRPSDAGWDLFALEDTVVHPGEFKYIPVGWKINVPLDKHLFALNTGSYTLSKECIIVLPGVIDAGYPGDIGPNAFNLGKRVWHVKRGDKVSQVLFIQLADMQVDPCFTMPATREAKEEWRGDLG
jgi:dUTP pyrophosphatase